MALTDLDKKRIAQAVVALGHYNKDPYMSDFVRKYSKPRIPLHKFDRKELPALIKRTLLGRYRREEKRYQLKLEDLITHLDDLQETGRQHVYLFRLPETERDAALKWLRNFDQVKARLGLPSDIFEGGRLVWEAEQGPQLALVRHQSNGRTPHGALLFKWVQTRRYWVPKKSAEAAEFDDTDHESTHFASEEAEALDADEITEADNAEEAEATEAVSDSEDTGEIVQIRVRLEERAVTYLLVDLENGHFELRIQALRSSARAMRQKQLDTYLDLMTRLFGFEPVGPTVLAPAIRRALITREVDILSCEAILPEGGYFTGSKDEFPPVDVRKLEAGLATSFKWEVPEGGLARIKLDGRLDEIFITRPMLPKQHRLVLDRIRKWREDGLVELSSNVKTTPQIAPVEAPQPTLQEVTTELETPGKPTRTQAGRAIAILRAAFTRGVQPERPGVEPGIDSAIREYTKTHVSEQSAGDSQRTRASRRRRPASRPVSVNELPLEQFLDYIKEVADSERSSYEREIKIVQNEEKVNSWLYFAAAILALAIVATGASLIFFSSKLAIGSITTLLGGLTGHGTWLIRSYRNSLKEKRELILEQQRDSHRTFLMIQMALLNPDPQLRATTMSQVARDLLARITQIKTAPATPKPSEEETPVEAPVS